MYILKMPQISFVNVSGYLNFIMNDCIKKKSYTFAKICKIDSKVCVRVLTPNVLFTADDITSESPINEDFIIRSIFRRND